MTERWSLASLGAEEFCGKTYANLKGSGISQLAFRVTERYIRHTPLLTA
ncbi:hypothetical protein PhiBTCVTUL1a_38 [Burkholderia phage phiBtTUL1a]|nr:hypothetical protein [Burkholderia thailandensis]WNO23847.1 hypothetical protein PhiBTCVTUL1a_38 [Burkholderia phage phiBtTUL1a]